MQSRRLRVLVAEDSEFARGAIRRLLTLSQAFEVVGEATDGAEAIAKAREYTPDVVLMDIAMPVVNGLVAARLIRRELPSIRVIVVTQHDSPAFRREAVAVGASGYVVKSNAGRELVPEMLKLQ